MKSFYSKFRIALMTLAIGLASVWFFSAMKKESNEILIDLPKTNSDFSKIKFAISKESKNGLLIFSLEKKRVPSAEGGGASGGVTCDEARARAKNKKAIIPNCS